MKEEQFLDIAASTRMRVKTLAAAKRVLVDQESLTEVAKDIKCPKQQLHKVIKKILGMAGMTRVRVCLPEKEIPVLKEICKANNWTKEE